MTDAQFPGGPSDEPDGNAQPNQPGQPGQPGQYPPPAGQQQGQPGQYPPSGVQPGQPGQPGQYPPPPGQGYAQPQAGQYPPPADPQAQYAYGQPPGGPPTGGSGSNKALWIILAAVASFVVLALIAVVALVVASGGDEGDGVTVTKTSTQPQVVKAYLNAVAKGDAKQALSLAAVQPLNKDWLTDEVLAESAKVAKITDIKVGGVANEYTSTVPATFKVGDQVVTEDFSVTKSGDNWKMNNAGSELDFTTMRKNTLPLMINGKALTVDKVTLFPGGYAISSGTDYVSYGETGQLTVKGNSDYLRSSDLLPTLTSEGERAFVQAVKASTRACLLKKELSPANCPNESGNSQAYKIDKSTIEWSRRGTDAFANLQPRLDYENPNIALARPSLELTIKADCSAPTGRCTLNTYNSSEATIDLTKDPLVVRWVD
ncbi:MAG: hypothetical protein ABIR34_11090 [Marmoricola sp.]